MSDINAQLQEIFRDVFDDDTIVLRDSMNGRDIDGWDSLTHINLIIAVEKSFGIKFATAEISNMKKPTENVGTFVKLIRQKLGKPA